MANIAPSTYTAVYPTSATNNPDAEPIQQLTKLVKEFADSESEYNRFTILSGKNNVSLSGEGRDNIFSLRTSERNYIALKNCCIAAIETQSKEIKIDSCFITQLRIEAQDDGGNRKEKSRVIIKNCNIGMLQLNSAGKRFGLIEIRDRYIHRLWLDQTLNAHKVILKNVNFGRRFENIVEAHSHPPLQISVNEPDAQGLSYLQTWADSSGNSEVMHIARGNQLAIERLDAKISDSIFLNIWRITSDYGLSPMRSFFIWASLLISAIIGLSFSDLVVTFDTESVNDWREILTTEGLMGRVYRATLASLESAFFPFSVLSKTDNVSPRDPIIAIILTAHGMLSTVLIFTFSLALKRRFRVT